MPEMIGRFDLESGLQHLPSQPGQEPIRPSQLDALALSRLDNLRR